MAEQQHQTHLGHELEQAGEPVSPFGDDLQRPGVGEAEGQGRDDDRQGDGEEQVEDHGSLTGPAPSPWAGSSDRSR